MVKMRLQRPERLRHEDLGKPDHSSKRRSTATTYTAQFCLLRRLVAITSATTFFPERHPLMPVQGRAGEPLEPVLRLHDRRFATRRRFHDGNHGIGPQALLGNGLVVFAVAARRSDGQC